MTEQAFQAFSTSTLVTSYRTNVSPQVDDKLAIVKSILTDWTLDDLKPGLCQYSITRRTAAAIVARALVGATAQPELNICGHNLSFVHMLQADGEKLYTKLTFLLRYFEKVYNDKTFQDDQISFCTVRFTEVAIRPPKSKKIDNALIGGGFAHRAGSTMPYMADKASSYIHHSGCGVGNSPVFGGALTIEELPFMLYPEYLVSMFLFGTLDKEEVVIASGLRRYASYMIADNMIKYKPLPPLEAQGRGIVDTLVRVGLMPFDEYIGQFDKARIAGNMRKYIAAFNGLEEGMYSALDEPIVIPYPQVYDKTLLAAIIAVAASLSGKHVLLEEAVRFQDMTITDLVTVLSNYKPQDQVPLKKQIML